VIWFSLRKPIHSWSAKLIHVKYLCSSDDGNLYEFKLKDLYHKLILAINSPVIAHTPLWNIRKISIDKTTNVAFIVRKIVQTHIFLVFNVLVICWSAFRWFHVFPSGCIRYLKCRQIRTHVHKQIRQEWHALLWPLIYHNIWYCISFYKQIQELLPGVSNYSTTDNGDNLSILLKRTKRSTLGCITLLMLKPYTRQTEFCCRQIQLLFAFFSFFF